MPKSEWMQVRCTGQEKDRWNALAQARGLKLSEYVRRLLNAAAQRQEERNNEQQRLGD